MFWRSHQNLFTARNRQSNQCCGSASRITLMQIRIRLFTVADPDPTFHFDADPDLAFHFYANLDPAPHQINAKNVTTGLQYRLSTAPCELPERYCEPPRLICEFPKLPAFSLVTDPDSDPAFEKMMRIRIRFVTLLRIRIRLPKMFRIRVRTSFLECWPVPLREPYRHCSKIYSGSFFPFSGLRVGTGSCRFIFLNKEYFKQHKVLCSLCCL